MPGMRGTDEVSKDQDQREEDYKKLFPKIGRDFVSREDLADILSAIVSAIPGLSVDIKDAKAVALATEYKKILDGQKNSKEYKDLIELEDDDQEKDKDKEEEDEEE